MGPLAGLRIIEIVGIGPGPFAGMMFADMGAEVIAIERPGPSSPLDMKIDITKRGKRSVTLDLKSEQGRDALFKLCETADALFEGFRPGTMEKLGLGPDDIARHNPKLVYGRMTGWGQTGPLAKTAGHDINYIALSGALHAMGPKDTTPTIPLNLVGDYGGGSMMLAFGMMCAIWEAQKSGKGQTVDTSIVEGASIMMSLFHSLQANGLWSQNRGTNLLDGGAHFYGTYETADGHFVSLGAMEPQFIQVFVEKTDLDSSWLQKHMNPAEWPDLKIKLTTLFKTKTRHEWQELLEGTEACFAPVMPFWEAHTHPHNQVRESFVEVDGLKQPAPTPKFSRTEPNVAHSQKPKGADTDTILTDLGYSPEQISSMKT